jgi:hypothetical protein
LRSKTKLKCNLKRWKEIDKKDLDNNKFYKNNYNKNIKNLIKKDKNNQLLSTKSNNNNRFYNNYSNNKINLNRNF